MSMAAEIVPEYIGLLSFLRRSVTRRRRTSGIAMGQTMRTNGTSGQNGEAHTSRMQQSSRGASVLNPQLPSLALLLALYEYLSFLKFPKITTCGAAQASTRRDLAS